MRSIRNRNKASATLCLPITRIVKTGRLLFALGIVAFSPMMCGCGSSRSSPVQSPPSKNGALKALQARHTYIARADSLCAAYNAKIRVIDHAHGSFPPIRRQIALAQATNLASIREATALLRIPGPGGLGELPAIYQQIIAAAHLANTSTVFIKKGDNAAANNVSIEAASEVQRINARLRTYGLATCAE
jgi:hypothetical protein